MKAAGVFLGHRRLSIVDLAGGAQPMWTADGAARRRLQRRDLQPRRAARGAEGARLPVLQTDHSRYRGAAARLSRMGRRLRRAAQWHVGLRHLRSRAAPALRPRATASAKSRSITFTKAARSASPASSPRSLAAPALPARPLARSRSRNTSPTATSPRRARIYERVWKLPGGHSFTCDLVERRAEDVSRYWAFELEPDRQARAPLRRQAVWREREPLVDAMVRRTPRRPSSAPCSAA